MSNKREQYDCVAHLLDVEWADEFNREYREAMEAESETMFERAISKLLKIFKGEL